LGLQDVVGGPSYKYPPIVRGLFKGEGTRAGKRPPLAQIEDEQERVKLRRQYNQESKHRSKVKTEKRLITLSSDIEAFSSRFQSQLAHIGDDRPSMEELCASLKQYKRIADEEFKKFVTSQGPLHPSLSLERQSTVHGEMISNAPSDWPDDKYYLPSEMGFPYQCNLLYSKVHAGVHEIVLIAEDPRVQDRRLRFKRRAIKLDNIANDISRDGSVFLDECPVFTPLIKVADFSSSLLPFVDFLAMAAVMVDDSWYDRNFGAGANCRHEDANDEEKNATVKLYILLSKAMSVWSEGKWHGKAIVSSQDVYCIDDNNDTIHFQEGLSGYPELTPKLRGEMLQFLQSAKEASIKINMGENDDDDDTILCDLIPTEEPSVFCQMRSIFRAQAYHRQPGQRQVLIQGETIGEFGARKLWAEIRLQMLYDAHVLQARARALEEDLKSSVTKVNLITRHAHKPLFLILEEMTTTVQGRLHAMPLPPRLTLNPLDLTHP
jgi:hypothetical protein